MLSPLLTFDLRSKEHKGKGISGLGLKLVWSTIEYRQTASTQNSHVKSNSYFHTILISLSNHKNASHCCGHHIVVVTTLCTLHLTQVQITTMLHWSPKPQQTNKQKSQIKWLQGVEQNIQNDKWRFFAFYHKCLLQGIVCLSWSNHKHLCVKHPCPRHPFDFSIGTQYYPGLRLFHMGIRWHIKTESHIFISN